MKRVGIYPSRMRQGLDALRNRLRIFHNCRQAPIFIEICYSPSRSLPLQDDRRVRLVGVNANIHFMRSSRTGAIRVSQCPSRIGEPHGRSHAISIEQDLCKRLE
jgi:hypothetical protein